MESLNDIIPVENSPFGFKTTIAKFTKPKINWVLVCFGVVAGSMQFNHAAALGQGSVGPRDILVSMPRETRGPFHIDIEGGTVAETALLLDDTNFAKAKWVSFNSVTNIILNPGEGFHDVWVGARRGNDWVWLKQTVKVDTQPPLIVITNPTSFVTAKPMIQLQGYSPEALARLTFDVSNAAGVTTDQQGHVVRQFYDTRSYIITTNWFQCFDISLTNGENNITMRATDLAGNTTVTNFIFHLDYSSAKTAPSLTLEWPQNGMKLSGNAFTLRGFVSDETATVRIYGVPGNPVQALVERDGHFWFDDLPLLNGVNQLSLTATAAGGQSTSLQMSVIGAALPLKLNPINPRDLTNTFVVISGAIAQPDYSIWVNGNRAEVKTDGTWKASRVPVSRGGMAVFNIRAFPANEAPTTIPALGTNPPPSANSVDFGSNPD